VGGAAWRHALLNDRMAYRPLSARMRSG